VQKPTVRAGFRGSLAYVFAARRTSGQYQKNHELIHSEQSLDGLYLLHTSLEPAQCAKEQVLGNYKNLLAVEDAFCQLKSYLEVRPVFHWRPDRVRNHVRLCFIAYWLCAKLANEGQRKGETCEVQRLLLQLQAIRVGTLKIAGQDSNQATQIPPEINTLLGTDCFLYLPNRPPGLRCSPKTSGSASSY
jgi:hypothetical protein